MPPLVVNATEPVWPKHNGCVGVNVIVTWLGAASIIVVADVVQPFASVAVNV